MSDGSLTRRRFVMSAASVAAVGGMGALTSGCGAARPPLQVRRVDPLPPPRHRSTVTIDEALASRRSHREFTTQPLTEVEISQLRWAAQGITVDWGGRTAPSAGALYPLEVYLLTSAAYRRYRPEGHRIELLAAEDRRAEAAAAALHQPAVASAAMAIVITAVYARTTEKYGSRGRRYIELEAGHAAQNVLLEAVAVGHPRESA